MRHLGLLALVIGALVVVAPASATVKRTVFTGSVEAGDEATLTVTVAPRARCTIKVVYDTVTSRANGLGAKTGTKITWRWRVGSNTHGGRWPVTVDCGKSGKLRVLLRVIPR